MCLLLSTVVEEFLKLKRLVALPQIVERSQQLELDVLRQPAALAPFRDHFVSDLLGRCRNKIVITHA